MGHYWAREITKLGHQVRLMPATAGPVDAASDARSFNAAADPGDQCIALAFGRARHCGREQLLSR